MASVAFPAEYVLAIRRLAVQSAAERRAETAVPWRWGAIADAASGITFLGVLGWAICHVGAQFLQVAGMIETQVAMTGRLF